MTIDRVSGGTEAQRGFVFQTYAVLLYMLIRRIELPRVAIADLQVHVEPSAGEDATFISCRFEADQPIRITELVQCKKSESLRSPDGHAGVDTSDLWRAGPINHDDFKQWLTRQRTGRAAVDDLADRSDTFYTAIVFGQPARKVEKYVPAGVVSRLWWYSPAAARAFPANYTHPIDPAAGQLAQRTFGTPEIRKRVRVLVVDSPAELQGQCEILLRQYFGVDETRAPRTVRRLRGEIERRSLAGSDQALSNGEIDAIIAEGRAGAGRWRNAREVLRWEESWPSTVRFDQPLTWYDFENNLHAARPAFKEAAHLLQEHGAVVASGGRGSGHTTVARYVAYQFLKHDGGRNAYFLTPAHAMSLTTEIEFLRSQISTDTLFVIDDEHLGVKDQIEHIVETFAAFQREQKSNASLLVTSRSTYSPSQHTQKSALNDFAVVHLPSLSIDECSSLLQSIMALRGTRPTISTQLVARASDGNLSVAMLMLQCAHEWRNPAPLGALLRHHKLGEAVATWVLQKIGRTGEVELLRTEIAPVFIAGFHHLSSPESLSQVMPALMAAGLVETDAHEGELTFSPTSGVVASIIRNRYQDLELDVIVRLLRHDSKKLPLIFSQLDRSDRGRALIRLLLQLPDGFQIVQNEITDVADPLTLGELSTVFEASYRSSRNRAQALLRTLTEPQGRPNALFFITYLHRGRVTSADGITRFFAVLDRIDRYPVRRLHYDKMSYREQEVILSLFEYDFCRLDAAARCLRALARCSRPFAQQLYRQWVATSGFAEKVRSADAAADGLTVWLSYCDALAAVDRHESQRFMVEHLSPERVARVLFATARFELWPRFLLRLRRLHPRLAATFARMFLHERRNSLDKAISRVDNLGVLVNQLFAISRFSRRAAVTVAFQQLEHLIALARAAQDQHRTIGSALDSLRRNISQRIARAVADALDAGPLLVSMQNERALNFIGRTLYNIHQISPAMAQTLVSGLEVNTLADRFTTSWLNQFAYLIRGLIAANDPARREVFIDDLVRHPTWQTELKRAWNESDLLGDLAFFALTVLEIGVAEEPLLAMLSFPNVGALEAELRERLRDVSDPLELAHGLSLLARLSPSAASETLSWYVDGTHHTPSATNESERATRRFRAPVEASPYISRNLSHVGTLAHVAAAIDPRVARRLIENFDMERFLRSMTDDPNLGRATDFILGVNRVSRARARELVRRTATPAIWQRQWEANEELANALRYAHALRRVSLDAARRYSAFLREEYGDDIEGLLDAEADLDKVSNWSRTLTVGGQNVDPTHGEKIARIVAETAEFDSRVFQMLGAAQALIECGQITAAASAAESALRNGRQLESLRELPLWITLFNRAVSIASATRDPTYPAELLSNVPAAVLANLLDHDSSVVLAAHAAHLAATCRLPIMEEIAETARLAIPTLRTRAMAERNTAARVIALTLLQSPGDQIRRAATEGLWNRPSDAGLAVLLFGTVFVAEDPLFDAAPRFVAGPFEAGAFERAIAEECDEHASNLTFGLALRLAMHCGLDGSFTAPLTATGRERADDESNSAVRWALTPQPAQELPLGSYHQTVFLKDTILQARYYINSASVEEVIVDMVRARKA